MIPPLMGKKKAVGLILGLRDEKPINKMNEGGMVGDDPIHVVAKELIEAVKGGDVVGVAAALKAAWVSMEAEEYEASEEG